MDRRDFLAGAALAAAPLYVPASAFGANDRINYGLIGTGGRGRYLNTVFKNVGAECVALCDVYKPNLEKAAQVWPQAKQFVDYNDLLAEKLDAVVIATPDHHHAPMLFAALKAGRDVYLEKPLSKSLEESLAIIEAVNKSKQVVQVGMQRRSAESIIKAKKLVEEGILGQVTLVKPQWHWNIAKPLNNSPLEGELDWNRFLGKAPKRPVEPQRFRSWRYFHDYAGGNMTDQGTHLMDVVQWFMNTGGPPRSAMAHGYVAKMKGAEHPDVFSAIFEFPNFLATWTLDYANSYDNGWAITFQGDKGTMILDEAGYVVMGEPWKPNAAPLAKMEAPVPVEFHARNFIECMKTRQKPNCPVEIAAAAVAGPHLANLAMFGHKRVTLPNGYLSPRS